MSSKKSLAIVGIGRWGKNLLKEFNKIADVRWIYHRGNRENSKWLDKNYPNIKTASSYRELLTNPMIDVIVIATPIKTHYELTRQALAAGKHVFVEKPITDNVAQAEELTKLATKKKLILFVGHIFSYHPVLAKIQRLNAVEPLKHAAFVWNKLGTFNEELIYNLLSHDIATALDLFGSSSTILPSGKVVLDKPISIGTLENRGMVTDSDIIYVRLGFKNNRSCTIYINRVSNFKNKTIFVATARNVYLWENNQLLKLDGKANTFRQIYKSSKTPLEVECVEFIKCLDQRKKPHTSGEFGTEVVKILSKI